jgi:hypothetical protein
MSSLRVALRLSKMESEGVYCSTLIPGSSGAIPMESKATTITNKTKKTPSAMRLSQNKKLIQEPHEFSGTQSDASSTPSATSTGIKRSAVCLNLPERPKVARRACSGLADRESTHTASLEMLASLIAQDKKVVVITGAGLLRIRDSPSKFPSIFFFTKLWCTSQVSVVLQVFLRFGSHDLDRQVTMALFGLRTLRRWGQELRFSRIQHIGTPHFGCPHFRLQRCVVSRMQGTRL